MGTPESELIESAQWGIPDGSYENGGKKFLIYNYHATSNLNGDTLDWHCKTVFTIEKNIVTGWSYDGNACRSN